MSIRCLANRSLEFVNGSERAKTTIGFCELPNWVGENPYFVAAVKDGSIKEFTGSSDRTVEDLTKESERRQALLVEIEELEEKLEKATENGNIKVQALKEEKAALEEEVAALKSTKAELSKKK
jgi:seryl-tRNA synthetase